METASAGRLFRSRGSTWSPTSAGTYAIEFEPTGCTSTLVHYMLRRCAGGADFDSAFSKYAAWTNVGAAVESAKAEAKKILVAVFIVQLR